MRRKPVRASAQWPTAKVVAANVSSTLMQLSIYTFVMRAAVAALLSVMVTGCSKSTPPELAELVIRTQHSDVPPDAVACISVDGSDADARLLVALSGIAKKVVPESACTYVADPSRGSRENQTGRSAVLVYVTTHPDRDEAEYLGRYHAKWAMRVVMKVQRDNDEWRIVGIVKREAA
jgi:hypothetical protein